MSRQSIKNHRKITALYLRISREDKEDDRIKDESNSITNQRELLKDIATKMKLSDIKEYVDDGVTGTKIDRKNFVKMCGDIEQGLVYAVIVKDLSRLSRDNSQATDLVEKFFPQHDIRFISVSDGYDSDNGEDEFLGFRTLMNEYYARDISKKRKLTNVVKNNAKEPLSLPPYGYQKSPDNPKRWIIDPEAAEVVKRIFQMTVDGMGTEQIAAALSADKVLTPMFYWRSKGLNRGGRLADREPHKWVSSTIVDVLSKQEYCGDIINHKTYSKSFKLKKRYDNPDKSIHRDMHEPLIDRDKWERIQEKRGKVRKRKTADGQKNIFSGLVVCADCGHNLWYHFNQKNHDIKYFNCSNYKGNRGTCESTHYIRVDFLEQVILQEVRRLTKFARQHEGEFAALVMGYSQQADTDKRQHKQKELYALTARDREIDKMLAKSYEDNVNGKLSDERFARLDKQYTLEQTELAAKVKALTVELEKQESRAMTADMFIATVRKYTRAKKLTERMLGELIERIEVNQSEKVDGVHRQRLTVHYNCVGAIEIPETFSTPNITVQTRKGVMVRYDPLNMTQ